MIPETKDGPLWPGARRAWVSCLVLAVFLVVFLIEYRVVISPLFSYQGMYFLDLGLEAWVAMTVFAVTPVFVMPLEARRPSDLLVMALFVLLYLPAIFIPPLVIPDFPLWIYDPILFVSFLILAQGRKVWNFQIRSMTMKPGSLRLALWMFLIMTVMVTLILVKAETRLFSPDELYDVRKDYKDALQSAPFFLPYMIGWSGNVVVPFLSLSYFRERKWLMLVLVMLCHFILFLKTAYKSFFFGLFVVFALFWFFSRRKFTLNQILLGISSLLMVGLLIDSFFPIPILSSIFHRRLLVIPGLLMGYYYDFFSKNPLAMLGHSFLSPIFNYPYSLGPANLISGIYFDRPDASANVGLWGDAYANFGLLGMVAYSAVASFFFRLYDELWMRQGLAFACAMLGLLIVSLANSAMFTVLLSHGLLFSLVIGLLAPPFHPPAALKSSDASGRRSADVP